MASLTWTDADEIGYQLSERYPDEDPLSVRFTDLRERVVALPGFAGAGDASSEPALEAIQMAWLEYFNERHGGG